MPVSLHTLSRLAWLLPGCLLFASFPPLGEKIDLLLALAPLLCLTRRGNARSSMWVWFANGLLFWVATLAWMPAIIANGGPWPLVVLGWFALAFYCSLYFAAFGFLAARYWRWAADHSVAFRLLGVFIVEPLLWCGLELLRSRLFGGFAWNQLGVVPANGGLGAPAALGGVYALSAVVIWVSGSLAGIIERFVASFRRCRLSPWRTLETLLAFAAVFTFYRVASIATPQPPPTGALKVALVQRNFPCVFKQQEENPYEIYGGLLGHIADLKPDLVVLSESALCDFAPIGHRGSNAFADWVMARTGAALLAGGSRRDDGGRTYNSAALYVPQGACQIYDKVHLVPFGEFIPGDKILTALQKLAPVGSCTPGSLKLLDLGGCALGVAICFEDTDSAQVRRLAAMGAQVLVFITNDSWFGHSNEAVQHAWQAVARALETGLTVVRVGNSGVTGTIAPDGRATWLLGADGQPLVDCRGTMLDRVPLAPPRAANTFYVRWGDIPLAVMFALLMVAMILVKYKDRYEKRRFVSV